MLKRHSRALFNSDVLYYGLAMAAILILLRWVEYRFMVVSYALELYVGSIALIFMILGIWVARKLRETPKKVVEVVERKVYVNERIFVRNDEAVTGFGLSEREIQVLSLMAEGLSNQQIAERIFVSVNTVKTHSARVFEKLGADRRTQAVDAARKAGIIP